MSYPYVQSKIAITDFFELLNNRGAPEVFDREWAKGIGVDSTYFGKLRTILQFLGFVNEAYERTKLWEQFREYSETALKKGILSGYSELINDIPNAFDEMSHKEVVEKWFKSKCPDIKSDRTIQYITNTYFTLCGIAKLSDSVDLNKPDDVSTPLSRKIVTPNKNQKKGISSIKLPEVSINLQIIMPDNAKAQTYDDIFSAISKFIYGIN